ncbi:MAG: hypothetical protein H0Z19_08420 [Archaeoglobus sp.]|uniref:hypothetical protein n=1 Tax=Archaeoglobus sp. TaxID=1872626 RepID=UPI001DC986BE|nr:hypothetical protein [Archaeoglobus sp.]MBO8180484.1 hypothetical protein [Archaeoglobus sp.]
MKKKEKILIGLGAAALLLYFLMPRVGRKLGAENLGGPFGGEEEEQESPYATEDYSSWLDRNKLLLDPYLTGQGLYEGEGQPNYSWPDNQWTYDQTGPWDNQGPGDQTGPDNTGGDGDGDQGGGFPDIPLPIVIPFPRRGEPKEKKPKPPSGGTPAPTPEEINVEVRKPVPKSEPKPGPVETITITPEMYRHYDPGTVQDVFVHLPEFIERRLPLPEPVKGPVSAVLGTGTLVASGLGLLRGAASLGAGLISRLPNIARVGIPTVAGLAAPAAARPTTPKRTERRVTRPTSYYIRRSSSHRSRSKRTTSKPRVTRPTSYYIGRSSSSRSRTSSRSRVTRPTSYHIRKSSSESPKVVVKEHVSYVRGFGRI